MSRYLFVFLFALCPRALYIAIAGTATHGTMVEDSYQYLIIAQNLLNHGAFSLETEPPFTPTTRRPPVYPAFLSILYLLRMHTTLQIAIVQAGLGALCCLLVFHLARQVMTERRATLTACFCAIFPASVALASAVSAETLFSLLLLLSVALTVEGIRRKSAAIIACGGAMLTISALCRPISLPLAAIFAVILALHSSRRLAASFVLGSVLALAPWAIRTSLVSRAFTPIQGYSAANVYLASQWWIDQKDYAAAMRGLEQSPYGLALRAAKYPAETAQADKMGAELAIRNIMTAPKAYLLSRLKSWPYLFITSFGGPSLRECWARRHFARLTLKLCMLLVFSIAPLALAFLSLRRVRENPAIAFCAAVWIFTLVAHLPLWIEYRFWAPAFPFLTICAFACSIGVPCSSAVERVIDKLKRLAPPDKRAPRQPESQS
ncbi:MAG TPA: glycosyltransferase family 39 protein [Blastocatellia bacterium]|nr:glycosyltransferase family 39 protein [Blastocatellia bacterium]